MVFEAQTGGSPLTWVLDGADLGAAAGLVVWMPLPGKHTLALVDAESRVRHVVAFEVRGAAHPDGS